MALRSPVKMYQHRGHVITSQPATEPVTAAELRTLMNETTGGLPDSEADDFIAEARQYIEEVTGLAFITQSWRLALDHWPTQNDPWWDGVRQGSITELYGGKYAGHVYLPRYPLQSVDTVTVYDEGGTSTAVTIGDVFDVDTYGEPGRMTLQRGATWPVALRANNAIEIVYTAGYGNAASDVPAALKGGIKRMAGHLYTHRGDGCGCEEAASATGVDKLIAAYKVARL